jgi:hypothetical protein
MHNLNHKPAPATRRTFRPGDRIRVWDGITSQYVWVTVSDVLISMGRQKLQVDSLGDFHFDEALVSGYTKGGK